MYTSSVARTYGITKKRAFITVMCLIMICVTGNRSATAQETREIKKTVSLNPDGRISIQAYKGSITVTTWDRSEVDIQARIEPDGYSYNEEKAVKETEIRIDERAGVVYIESDYERLKQEWRRSDWSGGQDINLPFVHYTLIMPRTARLDVGDYKSEIKVDGLRSDVRIDTYKGPISVLDLTGNLRVETHKSRVEIIGLSGSLDLNTHDGNVEVEFTSLTGRSRIESYKGDVDVTLPKGSGFDLDADLGRKGDLRTDFDIKGLEYRHEKHGRNREYRGAVNGGGPLLRLTTYKGYYRLQQR